MNTKFRKVIAVLLAVLMAAPTNISPVFAHPNGPTEQPSFPPVISVDTNVIQQSVDQTSELTSTLGTTPTLYTVSNAHLDTQWNWTIKETINQYIPNTLDTNMFYFWKYPDYKFSFEGAFRYLLAKEYYPDKYNLLKTYIDQGRWNVAGSSWDAGDVNVPSPEALFRNILYGNGYFKKEFGKTSLDIFLPDCFGFGWALPSIAAHAGLKGFSTQKLSWGSAYGVPFDLGKWVGPDGASIAAALNPESYSRSVTSDWSNNAAYSTTIANNGNNYGVFATLKYYGTGDTGGGPTDSSVAWIEKAITRPAGSIKVLSASSDQLFRDMTPAQVAGLPSWNTELVMTQHGTGAYTSRAIDKRWNRQNEQLADAAERASVLADWLGGATYPLQRLTEAWQRVIWHQFHDDLPGTSYAAAYTYSQNDYVLSLNQFAGELTNAVGVVARALDTQAIGVPVVVYNPLAQSRKDIVEARVYFTNGVPSAVKVFDPIGTEVPAQLGKVEGQYANVIFLADMPATGYKTYDIQAAAAPSTLVTGLSVTTSTLTSNRYTVNLDANGDIASIVDKANSDKELLSAPAGLQLLPDTSGTSGTSWPSWEVLYRDVTAAPTAVSAPVTATIVENGPARVAVQIVRQAAGSTFTQTIRLNAGDDADRVEIDNDVNWQTTPRLLKAAFPLSVTNPSATYDLGLGAITRTNNITNLFEVPAQQWADITNPTQDYGVSIMNDSKYGWDKPADNILRLTLIHTPQGAYSSSSAQNRQDLGKNKFLYAIYGHAGDWTTGGTVGQAARLNQPLRAFQTTSHTGSLGKSYSFLSVSVPQVQVKAVKKAESGGEVIVRVQETQGSAAANVQLTIGAGIASAREVNGQEDSVGPATVTGGHLVFDIGKYQPKTFALTLVDPTVALTTPISRAVTLPYNKDVVTFDGNETDGQFNSAGRSIPAELLPATITSEGIRFQLGPTADGQKNAVAANNQGIAIPAGYKRLYILAASTNGDMPVRFLLNGNPITLTIQDMTARVGTWDLQLSASNILGKPSIKRDPVAWIATHTHVPSASCTSPYNCGNSAYDFAYFFKYRIDLPEGVSNLALKLPVNPDLLIMALTVSNNTNDDTVPAGYLYDEAGPIATVPVTTPVSGGMGTVNLALNQPVTVEGGSVCNTTSEKPEFAVDGSLSTKWCSLGGSAYTLTVELSTTESIGGFILRNAGEGGENAVWNTADYNLLVSSDNITWTRVLTVTGNTANVSTHVLPVGNMGRYVKLNITRAAQPGQSNTVRLYEFEIYRAVPQVGPIANATLHVGDTYASSGSFTDSPIAASWTATVDYGDGSGEQPLSLNLDKTFDLSHVYSQAGYYTVKVKITNESGTGTASALITVGDPLCYTLSTSVNAVLGGSVAVTPAPNCQGGTQYTAGTIVTVTATANTSHAFSNWSGDAFGVTNPLAVNMYADQSVIANFADCYTLTTVAAPSGKGDVAVAPAPNCGAQYVAGTAVTLTATPITGWHLSAWSGGLTGNANSAAIIIDSSKTITATFAQNSYGIYLPLVLRGQ